MTYTEAEIRTEALTELANSKTGKLTTSELIQLLEDRLKPSGHDAQIADGRGDTYFSQKVRNLVSHRDQNPGLSNRGLAVYRAEDESWTITSEGRDETKLLI